MFGHDGKGVGSVCPALPHKYFSFCVKVVLMYVGMVDFRCGLIWRETEGRKACFFENVCLRMEKQERKCWGVGFGAKAIWIFALQNLDWFSS